MWSRLAPRHQTRREIHRIAHHGVRAPIERSDVASEHRTTVDPDANWHREFGIDDLAQREQHALLVVAGDPRRTRGQYQLATIRIDIGAEECDFLFIGSGLDNAYKALQRLGGSIQANAFDQRVCSFEADERNRHGAMFRHAAAGQHMRANRRRQALRDRLIRHRGPRPSAAVFRYGPGARAEGAFRGPCFLLCNGAGRSAAVSVLSKISPALPLCSIATSRLQPGPVRQQFDVRCADREEMEFAAVHTLGHAAA